MAWAKSWTGREVISLQATRQKNASIFIESMILLELPGNIDNEGTLRGSVAIMRDLSLKSDLGWLYATCFEGGEQHESLKSCSVVGIYRRAPQKWVMKRLFLAGGAAIRVTPSGQPSDKQPGSTEETVDSRGSDEDASGGSYGGAGTGNGDGRLIGQPGLKRGRKSRSTVKNR